MIRLDLKLTRNGPDIDRFLVWYLSNVIQKMLDENCTIFRWIMNELGGSKNALKNVYTLEIAYSMLF